MCVRMTPTAQFWLSTGWDLSPVALLNSSYRKGWLASFWLSISTVQGSDHHRDPRIAWPGPGPVICWSTQLHPAHSDQAVFISFYIQEGAPHSFVSLDVCSVSCPLLWDRVLLGSLGCSGILCKRGWPWTEGDPAASASLLLGLLVYAAMSLFRGRRNHWVRVDFILVKMCLCATVSIWRPKDNFVVHSLLLSLLGFWGSNSCCQAFGASSFSAETSCLICVLIFTDLPYEDKIKLCSLCSSLST